MDKTTYLRRGTQYTAKCAQDLLTAFKLLLSPKVKLPVWDFVVYFGNLAANQIPGAKKLMGQKRQVDFSEYMKAYDETTATFIPYKKMLARIVELMKLEGGESVVDLGSGTGNLSITADRQGANVTSIDYSIEAMDFHRRKMPGANLLRANIDHPIAETGFIQVPDQSADFVCTANVWTYIKNRPTLYNEIKRMLKLSGKFVFAVERQGYSPTEILKGHIRAAYELQREQGELPLTAMLKVYAEFIAKYESLLVTAEESKKLMRGITAGDYKVFTEAEIVRELIANGFIVLSLESAYAGQAIIVIAQPIK